MTAGWLLVFSTLIVFLPAVLAEILSLALVNGHTWGAMTWLVYQVRLNYFLCLLYFVFSAALFIGCERGYRRAIGRH